MNGIRRYPVRAAARDPGRPVSAFGAPADIAPLMLPAWVRAACAPPLGFGLTALFRRAPAPPSGTLHSGPPVSGPRA